jgi:hypothetical protein
MTACVTGRSSATGCAKRNGEGSRQGESSTLPQEGSPANLNAMERLIWVMRLHGPICFSCYSGHRSFCCVPLSALAPFACLAGFGPRQIRPRLPAPGRRVTAPAQARPDFHKSACWPAPLAQRPWPYEQLTEKRCPAAFLFGSGTDGSGCAGCGRREERSYQTSSRSNAATGLAGGRTAAGRRGTGLRGWKTRSSAPLRPRGDGYR